MNAKLAEDSRDVEDVRFKYQELLAAKAELECMRQEDSVRLRAAVQDCEDIKLVHASLKAEKAHVEAQLRTKADLEGELAAQTKAYKSAAQKATELEAALAHATESCRANRAVADRALASVSLLEADNAKLQLEASQVPVLQVPCSPCLNVCRGARG